MAPVHSCMYASLLVVVPHDLTRDILNGIFGRRERNGDWGEGKERAGEQLRFPWDRLASSRGLSTGERGTFSQSVPRAYLFEVCKYHT